MSSNSNMMRRAGGWRRLWIAGAALSVIASPAALAQVDGPPTAKPHERFDQGPAIRLPAAVQEPVTRTFERAFPFTSQVNVNGQGLDVVGDAANEPSMTVHPSARNLMAAGWRQFDSVSSNFRQAGIAYSRDGGRTWINNGPLTPGVFRTDPVLDTSAEGVFYYNSLVGTALLNCDTFFSTDGGVNWSAPIPSKGGDKNWMVVDRGTGIGRGNLYFIWSPFFSCCNGIFTRSTDGGQTYMNPIPVPRDPYFGMVTTAPDGRVYAAGVDRFASGFMTISRSDNAMDAGVTPTFAHTLQVNLGGPARANTGAGPNPGGLLGQVWVVVNPSSGPQNGAVYLFCSIDPAGTDPMDVVIRRSRDLGATWSPAVKVNDESAGANAWQWLGTLSVAPGGRLDAVWNDTAGTGGVNFCQTRYSYSLNSGDTWSPGVALGPVWNSHVGWPQQNKIGDYYQIISDDVGCHVVYATTYNGGQDIFMARIGDYDCDGDGVGDAAEIAAGAPDCDGNGVPDPCELAAGAAKDLNNNGLLDVCEACGSDVNGDGFIDGIDYDSFNNAFEVGDPYADFNEDGFVDGIDYDLFNNAFENGC